MADPSQWWLPQAYDWTLEALGVKLDPSEVAREEAKSRLAGDRYATPVMQDTTQSDAIRTGYQIPYLDMAMGAARGEVPSAAELMLKRSMDENAASMNSMAASGRGGVSPALLQKMAMDAGSEANQRGIAELAVLRAREQEAARNALGGAIYGVRGQDIGLAGANQGATMDANRLRANVEMGTLDRGMTRLEAERQQRADAVGKVAEIGTNIATQGQSGFSDDTGGSYKTDTAGGPVEVTWGDGGFVTEPTRGVVGEAGPEAVVPITGPEDAAVLAGMIDKARQKKDAEDYARRMGELAVKMTGGPTRADAASAGARMGDFAAQATGGPATSPDPRALARMAEMQAARDYAARLGQLAVQRTGGR